MHAHALLVLDGALLASDVATLTYQTCAILLLLLLEHALAEDVAGLALVIDALLVADALAGCMHFHVAVVDVGTAGRADHVVAGRLIRCIHLFVLVLQHPLRHGVG